MIAKILTIPYGSVWKLREKCQSKSGVLAKLASFIYELYQYENNSAISSTAKFSSEPCFPHGMKSIFVSGGAEIGENCIIFQQVTIGSVTLPDSKGRGAPTIGDNVYIGAGAKIIGSVKVGNNVRIGANTVVYKDVPDNCVVTSSEQKNIQKKDLIVNRYYSFNRQWLFFERGQFKPVLDQAVISALMDSNIIKSK